MANFSININKKLYEAVIGETVSKGDILYLGTDHKWYLAAAGLKSKSTTELAIALDDGVENDEIDLLAYGYHTYTNSLFLPGTKYYLSIVSGKSTADRYENNDYTLRYVGTAFSDKILLFNPDQTYISDRGTRVNDVEFGGGGGGIVFTTDESLYLDPITNELRANLTTTIDTFDYLSGVQEFTLTETPVRMLYIWVQGVGLVKKNVQYEVDEVNKKLTILDELVGGEVITACYHNVINESVTPFVTDVQVENKDLDVFKNESADPYVRFSQIPSGGGGGGGVQSVTGDGVSGTPEDVILTFPTPAEIGAIEDAPENGKVYGRKDAVWEEIGQVGGGDMLASMYDPAGVEGDAFDFTNMHSVPPFLEDAPSDGKQYARKDANWDEVIIPSSGVQSVTGDGVGGTSEDVVMTFPTPLEIGAIEDAPSDGKLYGRKSESWEEVKEFQGVETTDTLDIELSGDGTENDKLKAELTQAVKVGIANGVTAYGWGDHSSAGYQLVSNIRQNLSSPNATTYPSTQAVHDALLAGIPKEEKITGTRYTNTSASGVLTFDMDSYKVFDLILTGNTNFQIQNPPTGTETKVIEGLVTGDFGLGLPLDWVPFPNNDDYIGSMTNHIVVTFIKSGYGGIFYSLQNIILNE